MILAPVSSTFYLLRCHCYGRSICCCSSSFHMVSKLNGKFSTLWRLQTIPYRYPIPLTHDVTHSIANCLPQRIPSNPCSFRRYCTFRSLRIHKDHLDCTIRRNTLRDSFIHYAAKSVLFLRLFGWSSDRSSSASEYLERLECIFQRLRSWSSI